MIPPRRILLEGIHNLRDLGGYPVRTGGFTRWKQLYRSDGLHRLSPSAQTQLLQLELSAIIDLRSPTELEEAPNPFSNRPPIKYWHVPLFEPLKTSGVLDFGGGFDLPTLYRWTLDRAQEPIAQTLQIIAEASGPILFHCTAGKDRTGIIAALLLANAQVEESSIVEDYAATAVYGSGLMDQLRLEARRKGLDLDSVNPLLLAEPGFMQSMLEHLNQAYGGVRAFLHQAGLAPSTVEALNNRLHTASVRGKL